MLIGLLFGSVAVMALTVSEPGLRTVFVLASFAAGGIVVLIWRQGGLRLPLVLGVAVIFRLAFLWLPPTLSDDAYRYVWDGLIQRDGYNPYVYVPADPELAAYQDEPIYKHLNSERYYSVYPPVSQLIFRAGALFYDEGWQVSYYIIKGILAALEMAALFVLARMIRPDILLLYAWNPLVVIASAGQAHGEAALALFLSLTLFAAWKGRGMQAAVWLGLASWVKLYPVLLFPLLLRRFGWRSAVAGSVCMIILAVPYVHPEAVVHVRTSLDLYVRLFEFNAGFYFLLKELLELVTGVDWSKQIGPALRSIFLLVLPLIYFLDWKRSWPLERAFAVVIGAFLILATTVHPWYLVGVLVVTAAAQRTSWHWYWLSIVSIGTYLLYVDGPYWPWVVIGWTGWMVLIVRRYGREWLDALMRYRARGKADVIAPFLSRQDVILDIGAAEGFVAERLVQSNGVSAQLVDIAGMNRTNLPHQVYDGDRLPHADNEVDVAVLVYVLHHADDPRSLLSESARVAARRVIILESTYARKWEEPLLRLLDHALNFIRSLGRMDRETLHFRTHRQWLRLFDELGLRVAARRDFGGFIHHRSLFILDVTPSPKDVDTVP